jgi:hypothetical protein
MKQSGLCDGAGACSTMFEVVGAMRRMGPSNEHSHDKHAQRCCQGGPPKPPMSWPHGAERIQQHDKARILSQVSFAWLAAKSPRAGLVCEREDGVVQRVIPGLYSAHDTPSHVQCVPVHLQIKQHATRTSLRQHDHDAARRGCVEHAANDAIMLTTRPASVVGSRQTWGVSSTSKFQRTLRSCQDDRAMHEVVRMCLGNLSTHQEVQARGHDKQGNGDAIRVQPRTLALGGQQAREDFRCVR